MHYPDKKTLLRQCLFSINFQLINNNSIIKPFSINIIYVKIFIKYTFVTE